MGYMNCPFRRVTKICFNYKKNFFNNDISMISGQWFQEKRYKNWHKN